MTAPVKKSVLENLLESRDGAQKAFDEFVTEVRSGKSALTDEQIAERRAELRQPIVDLDERIDEEHEKRTREAHLAEVRRGIVPTGDGILYEPTVYGKGSENSYYLDLVHVAAGQIDPQFHSAHDRLTRASQEAAREMLVSKDPEVRSRIRNMLVEEHRNAGKDEVRDALKRAEALGQTGRGELRQGMDTGATSGGSFATPVYFIQKYAPYREAGRAFADQCNAQDLPAYGMVVYIPHVTSSATIAAQPGENQGIANSSPGAGFLSGNLNTLAGEVPVSQQLLDRAGPGFAFDKMVNDQLERDYAPKLDQFALTQALASAGSIAYTDASGFTLMARTAPGVGGFYGKVSNAKQTIRKAAGVYMNPTHLFVDPARWEYMAAWADSNGRPAIVPDYAGPFNAVAAGNPTGDAGIEGYTGYRLNGLRAFQDANIPAPATGNDQAVVGNLDEVYLFEGTPVPRIVPQTLAPNLSVLIQLYSYVACIVRYPTAVQAISGSGMSAPSF